MACLETDKAWGLVVAIWSIELAVICPITFYMHCRRGRTGKGPSPYPPLTFALHAGPPYLSKQSLVFNQSGFTLARMVETVVTGLIFMGILIYLVGFLPITLADWLCASRSKDQKADDRKKEHNSAVL